MKATEALLPSQHYRYQKNISQCLIFFCKNKACVNCGTHQCHNSNLVTDSLRTGENHKFLTWFEAEQHAHLSLPIQSQDFPAPSAAIFKVIHPKYYKNFNNTYSKTKDSQLQPYINLIFRASLLVIHTRWPISEVENKSGLWKLS